MSLESVKPAADGVALTAAVGAFFKLLPEITAVFALIYLLLRIGETEGFKWLVRKIRNFFNRR